MRARRLLLLLCATFNPYTADAWDLVPIVESGTTAPGTTAPFFTLASPSINRHGEIAFIAWTEDGGTIADRGIWRSDGIGGLELVVLQDDPAPGSDPPAVFQNVSWPTLSDDRSLAFRGRAGVGTDIDVVYGSDSSGALIRIMGVGDPVPGQAGPATFGTRLSVTTQVLNPNGLTVATPDIRASGLPGGERSALLVPDGPLALALAAQVGDVAPGGAVGEVFDGFGLAILDASGGVGLRAWFAGPSVDPFNDEAIWKRAADGSWTLLAREGAPAPGVGRAFGSPFFLVGNPRGDLAVSETGSIWRTTGTTLALEFAPGDTLSGPDGGTIVFASAVALNDANQILALIRISRPGEPDATGYWLASPDGSVELVAEEGAVAPVDDPTVTFAEIRDPQLNLNGEMIFYALLEGPGVDTTNRSGVFAYDLDGVLSKIGRAGDLVEVAPGDWRTIDLVTALEGDPNPFSRRQLNDAGEFALNARFEDDSEGIYMGTFRDRPRSVPGLGALASVILAGGLGLAGVARAQRWRPATQAR